MHPLLTKVEVTSDDARYRITLVDEHGIEVHAVIKIQETHGRLGGTPEPDIFLDWDGDAESVRRVVGAVTAFHRARDLNRPD